MQNASDGKGDHEREDGVGDGEIIDLSICVPKTSGRSFVWTENLFMLDPLKRPVCTCCGLKVAAGKGSSKSISNNTTNLISHYESRRLDKAHATKLEEARSTYEPRANKGKGSPAPRGQQRSDAGGAAISPKKLGTPPPLHLNLGTPPPDHLSNMRNTAGGNPAGSPAGASGGQRQGQGSGGADMDQDVEELVDLTTCTPKVGGRSFVWKSELFVLDPFKQPVCTACGVRVPAGNGTTQSNTTNLICHYESRKSDKNHAEKLEKARKEYEENKAKGTATPKKKGSAK